MCKIGTLEYIVKLCCTELLSISYPTIHTMVIKLLPTMVDILNASRMECRRPALRNTCIPVKWKYPAVPDWAVLHGVSPVHKLASGHSNQHMFLGGVESTSSAHKRPA